MVNPSSSSVCSGCGSVLVVEQNAAKPISETKSTKRQSSQTPPWLKAILGIFALYIIVVVVYEIQQVPSGSVQNNQQTAVQQQTDPHVLDHITDLEKQIAANPKDTEIALQLANALHDAKLYQRAIDAYRKYISLNPKNNDARVDLGICYFEVGDLERSIKEIESVVKAEPKHQMAMFNLGIIQLSSKNMPEAEKWLKKCIEIDPQSTAGLRAQQILQQHQ